jgi:hypothetical protein
MKAIFFNSPIGTKKLAVTLTDNSVKDLMESDVIPKNSSYLSFDVKDPENLDPGLRLKIMHVDKVIFDNYTSPSKLLLDMEMMTIGFLEYLRDVRSAILLQLDNLQVRALIADKRDIVSQIETDKQKFRDFSDIILTKNYKTTEDFLNIFPDIFFVDYNEKYGSIINT